MAQEYSAINENDSILKIVGKVINLETQNPVATRITFEKIPYGSNFIISISDGLQGEYETFLIKGNGYRIEVKAEGFMPYSSIVDVNDQNLQLPTVDIFLVPSEVGRILTMNNLIFKQSKAEIVPSSYEELDMLVNMLLEKPSMKVQLEGHTDFRGNPLLNFKLSEERVEAVRDYLVSKGIKKRRIKLKAFGGTMPITQENSEEAQRKNRRVEVRILKK